MASALPRVFTKPENLGSSAKRIRGPNIYSDLLPLTPSPPSFLSSFLSSLPFISPLSPPQIEAIYDDMTKMICVYGEEDMKLLWRKGFFGKGSLSRSEPSWKRRVENRIAEAEGREKKLTSEEITAQRRVDRKGTKLIKKLEREAERFAAASAAESERGSSVGGSSPPTISSTAKGLPDFDDEELEDVLEKIVEEEEVEEDIDADVIEGEDKMDGNEEGDEEEEAILPPPPWQLDAEHTQLQPEEAFFLLFALGTLSLRSVSPLSSTSTTLSPPLSILSTWSLLLLQGATLLSSPPTASLSFELKDDPRLNRFDSPFLINYASYHHFRSMGWVVRSGVKFCSDWVLYGQGGPVGGHAEFAVIVVPNYVDPQDAITCPFKSTNNSDLLAEGENKNSWRWFNTVNRVCSGVKKTLVLLHVLIPPMSSLPSPDFIEKNPAQAMAMLQMRELTFRRFMAGRQRD